MPWRLIFVRRSGRKPVNSRRCKICEREVVGEEAWRNRNKHRSKYVCKVCFPKMWVSV